ncbi:hypothetical protein BGX34_005254 [Mortierella sp. NVP85]|nr:hypothetical protein BGX34_005254 [Mortierella sp. NVP85]
MAPLRALLSSKAVIAGFLTLACIGLFASTNRSHVEWVKEHTNYGQDTSHRNEPGYGNNQSPNNVNNGYKGSGKGSSGSTSSTYNNNNNVAFVQWEDAKEPPVDPQPLGVYPGKKPKTVRHMLEKAEGFYQRIVEQRRKELEIRKFGTNFACPHDIQRVGPISDGGKWICGMSLYEEKPRAKCVIYSFGVNYETRFEGEMLDRTDCEIWAYDASVTEMGPEAQGPRSHFKPIFVGKKNELDKNGTPWRTLKSLMEENGHDWIDILKVDIEGSEFDTFNAIMDDFGDELPFSQLQIELHVRADWINFPDFLKWWERLESKGVYPWWTELNLNPIFYHHQPWAAEYCFLNTRGGHKNLLIQNYI